MNSRRDFVGQMVAGATTVALTAPARVLGANDRIRLGVIGVGDRGLSFVPEVRSCSDPNVEFVGFADVYTGRLQEAKKLVPTAKTYFDYRYLLEDKSIDAVMIATPPHLHCEHFVASMDAGKHVYQEKVMAFNVDHAKRMRTAFQRAGKRTVQVGHQSCSWGRVTDAVNFLATGQVGKITSMLLHMFRNTPHGKPQWQRPILPDMTSENIMWKAFLGGAPDRPFDANRYVHWRYFWDYSGGNVFENMSHQLSFWYKVLKFQIPRAVTMRGGIYLWKDGREVPDTMNTALEQPEDVLINWISGFGNNELFMTEYVMGTDGTLVSSKQFKYLPQKVNRPDGVEMVGKTKHTENAHVQNFLDCLRSGKEPNCPFDLAFRVSIACRMAVESYRQGRTIRWDPVKEETI